MERFLFDKRWNAVFIWMVFLILISFLASCAHWKAAETPRGKYLAALTEFNDMVEDYIEQYNLQTPAIQADWKKEIDPWIKKASKALDAWGKAVDENAPVEAKIKEFEELKDVVIATLIAEGIVKIDKE